MTSNPLVFQVKYYVIIRCIALFHKQLVRAEDHYTGLLAFIAFIKLLHYIDLKYCNCEHPIVLFYTVHKITEKVIMCAM